MKVPKRKFKRLKQATIAYREFGSKEGYPIFCLPPWPASSYMYAPLAENMDKKYKLIAMELPGWGGESELKKGTIEIDTYLDLISSFIKSFNIKEYVLLGCSYGGVLVQGLTQDGLNPKAVILISTSNGGFHLFENMRYKPVIKGAGAMRRAMRDDELFKKAMIYPRKVLVMLRQDRKSLDFADEVLEDMGEFSVHDALKSVYSLQGRSFLSKKLKGTNALLIRGSKDPPFVKQGMKDISEYMKSKVHIIPNVDHYHFALSPKPSADLIKEFLEKVLGPVN
ncbi:alpha/beta fold hydrolase [Patescibacteria group bacterium]